MLAVIALTFCLAGQPCETVQVPIRVTLIECMIHGQQIAAWWQQQNPTYQSHTLRRWRCETGGRA